MLDGVGMIASATLKKLARARLSDARILLRARRYDGAVYMGGYVVELALKARICRTLGWEGYPETRAEFQSLSSFKTHDLDVLLSLSGRERAVKTRYLGDWSAVANWDPEARYRAPGTSTQTDAALLLTSAESLLKVL